MALKPDPVVAVGVLHDASRVASRVTGLVTPRMVRSPSTFHSSAAGRIAVLVNVQVGMVLDVEEVVGPEVVVAVLVVGVDADGLDGHRDLRVGRVLGQLQGALEVVELAADLRHGHVADGEAERGCGDMSMA